MAKCNVNTQERFADIQMLRYELKGFENLSLTQKIYIYCLSKATLLGRDITFDQQGKYNLRIRKTLEAVYRHYEGNRESEDFKAFEVYLKRVWFASGIYHTMDVKSLCQDFQRNLSMKWLRRLPMNICLFPRDRARKTCWAFWCLSSSIRKLCLSA